MLAEAVTAALAHDSKVVIEEAVPGFEVGCAVMGNEELTVGLVDEIALSEGFFNYEEKYTLKTSAIHCPAASRRRRRQRSRQRQKPFTVPWTAGYSPGGSVPHPGWEIVFNEVNHHPRPSPPTSRYPSMMQASAFPLGSW